MANGEQQQIKLFLRPVKKVGTKQQQADCKRFVSEQEQGCQIFLGKTYQNGKNIPI
jgi:hypothetical protein